MSLETINIDMVHPQYTAGHTVLLDGPDSLEAATKDVTS